MAALTILKNIRLAHGGMINIPREWPIPSGGVLVDYTVTLQKNGAIATSLVSPEIMDTEMKDILMPPILDSLYAELDRFLTLALKRETNHQDRTTTEHAGAGRAAG